MNYSAFFEAATRFPPYPYQEKLAEGPWPDRLKIPTGLGKTGAVALAWAYRHLEASPDAHTRLVWCLPMKVLVEQTADVIEGWLERLKSEFSSAGKPLPRVQRLLGGHVDADWTNTPEVPTVIVGTQDMLLSRALMRGYGMNRFAWPMHYAWLHNDALWVFDETQLMGVGVETSAQLAGLRKKLGSFRPTHSLWMSATLGDQQLDTVDHPLAELGPPLALGEKDFQHEAVVKRTRSKKANAKAGAAVAKDTGIPELVSEVLNEHQEGSLTLVILNRVSRAQEVFEGLLNAGRTLENTALLHSRFRRGDRAKHMEMLKAEGDRIIVSTQVIEAGVDISSKTMFTELAPWSSLVQRFGRCNRGGEFDDARVFWVDIEPKDEKDELCLPYTLKELDDSRAILSSLDDVGPESLSKVNWHPSPVVRPVIRRRDLLELFDTTADLSGDDLDVSRYVRDSSSPDVFVYWRSWEGEKPSAKDKELQSPREGELCRISISQAVKFLKDTVYTFNHLTERWELCGKSVVPGKTYLVPASAGGYTPELGFTGKKLKKGEEVEVFNTSEVEPESMDSDPRSFKKSWITLADHTEHVVTECEGLLVSLGIDGQTSELMLRAARWHDTGKAHEVFQHVLAADKAPNPGTWAKSALEGNKPTRKFFRHELASMLIYKEHFPDDDLGAFIILAHHGKVRLSLRALPDETRPKQAESIFARGVWDGDVVKAAELGGATRFDDTSLDLSLVRLGPNSWAERMLRLRDSVEMGPFRMSYLEAILRSADQRASAKEAEND